MSIKWVTGPLGYQASEDWRYWVPTLPDGKFRAFYCPSFMLDTLLGDDLPTLEEAKALCEAHYAKTI